MLSPVEISAFLSKHQVRQKLTVCQPSESDGPRKKHLIESSNSLPSYTQLPGFTMFYPSRTWKKTQPPKKTPQTCPGKPFMVPFWVQFTQCFPAWRTAASVDGRYGLQHQGPLRAASTAECGVTGLAWYPGRCRRCPECWRYMKSIRPGKRATHAA